MTETKMCRRCLAHHPVSEFWRGRSETARLNPYCKACILDYQAKRRAKARETRRRCECQ